MSRAASTAVHHPGKDSATAEPTPATIIPQVRPSGVIRVLTTARVMWMEILRPYAMPAQCSALCRDSTAGGWATARNSANEGRGAAGIPGCISARYSVRGPTTRAGLYSHSMPSPSDSVPLRAVILAAGFGSRLGKPFPKPLTPLASGRTIMGRQIDGIREAFGEATSILVVVGFKLELIMEEFPELLYCYNERYDQTNTAKSLLRAVHLSGAAGVLWFNGDVVFDPAILRAITPHIAAEESFVCVNTSAVGEEEIKYTVDPDGMVRELSKTVRGGLGEAIGINYVAPNDKDLFRKHLEGCADTDYFERGLETAIEAGMRVRPVDISRYYAVEVDFEADLERANEVTRDD